jgi:iron complex transport system ATP-binding protein
MTASKLLLEAKGLTVTAGPRTLIDSLGLSVQRGELWCVLGPNGCGKTTLLHTLAGLRAPDAGAIEIDGLPLPAFEPRELARFRGLLPQDDSDPFPATALETVLVGRHPHLSRWRWEGAEDLRIAREALSAADLAGAEKRDVRTLSGGERRRVALATLLAQQPRLFLLDEPSSHLDLSHQIALLDQLVQLARSGGRALIMALHDVNLAARCCDHALLLDRGSAAAGPAEQLLTGERLSALYGVSLRTLRDDGRNVFVT